MGIKVNQSKQLQLGPSGVQEGQKAPGRQIREPLCLRCHVNQSSPTPLFLARTNGSTYRQENAMSCLRVFAILSRGQCSKRGLGMLVRYLGGSWVYFLGNHSTSFSM